MEYQVGTKRKSCNSRVLREMTCEEEELIARMHKLIGDRWNLIAGRIPGRTAEEVERYWKSKRQRHEDRDVSFMKDLASQEDSSTSGVSDK